MPDVLTHLLCGKKALKKVENEKVKLEIQKRINLFYLGCQGPDLFIYYHSAPWKDKGNLKNYGHILHEEKTGQFFLEAIKYINNLEKESNDYYDLLVYILGYMCHFNMDKNGHPFIFYFGGVDDKKTHERKKYNNYHKKLEMGLDVLIGKKFENIILYKYKLYKQIQVKDFPNIICKFFKASFKEVYNIDINENVPKEAAKDMVNTLKYLQDPYQVKRKLIKLFYNCSEFNKYLINTIYPKKLEDNIDYANEKHIQWSHPLNKNIKYTSSFYDLFYNGIKDSYMYMNIVIDYFNGKHNIEELLCLFDNISYATGFECGRYLEMDNFECIFD